MNLICDQISKAYAQRMVLSIEHLAVPSGALFGIIGPNGAGKSTLLRIMAGLEDAKGTVTYDGQSFSASVQKQITMVFQRPYRMCGSVLENVAYPLRLRGVLKKDAHAQAHAILEPLGLLPLAKQRAQTLSGGEAQKMALARALVFGPSLLLLDEPTANIDPVSMREIEHAISLANQKGATVIMVTHNVAQAARMCSDVAFLYQGNVHEVGKTDEIIYHPKRDQTRAFICESSI